MNTNNNRTLEIFTLCKRLHKLLGEKEAIADITKFAELHPEMFNNIQEVIHTIAEVVKEPDIIVKNPRAKSDKDFIAGKKLDEKKMGDVGIRNDSGTNVIFHVNKKNIKKFKQLEKKQSLVGSPNSHTLRPARLSVDSTQLSNGAKAHSTIAKDIIAQNPKAQRQNAYHIANADSVLESKTIQRK